jgi:4-amino-4-deoxy-L-arabinose transferase-like glycosyltransferase
MNLNTNIKYWKGLILLLFGVAVAKLLIGSLFHIVYHTGVDEGYYFSYSQKVLREGLPVFKGLLSTYLADNSFWGFPVPLRFGFVILGSFFFRVFGVSFTSLSLISYFSFFCAVFFAYRLSRRIFGENAAFLAGLLFLASPLALALARRSLADSAGNLFLLTAFLLQIDYFLGFPQWRKKWILAVFIFLAVAFKETNILFILPLAVSSLAFLPLKNIRQILSDWIVIYLVPVAAIFITYKFLFGSFRDIFTVLFFLPSANSQGYVAYFQSGPWFRYLLDFMLVSPWVTVLGLYYLVHVFIKGLQKEKLAVALFIAVTILVHSFFPKNLRYISVVDYPLRIFAVLALLGAGREKHKHVFLFAFSIVSFICVMELVNFSLLFVRHDLYDPVSIRLLSLWKIIPGGN